MFGWTPDNHLPELPDKVITVWQYSQLLYKNIQLPSLGIQITLKDPTPSSR